MELLNDAVRVVKPKAIFSLDKKKIKHNILSLNGFRVCDFLMNMLQT